VPAPSESVRDFAPPLQAGSAASKTKTPTPNQFVGIVGIAPYARTPMLARPPSFRPYGNGDENRKRCPKEGRHH
jgi:hypothetical protein